MISYNCILALLLFFFTLCGFIYFYNNLTNSECNPYFTLCNNRHKTILVDNYKDVIIKEACYLPILIKVKHHQGVYEFFNLLKDVTLNYSISGTTKDTIGQTTHSIFLSEIENKFKNYYVYHFTKKDTHLMEKINHCFPPPTTYFTNLKNMNIVIYSGGKHTGTYIHKHTSSLNYLVYGKKLWIIFPSNEKNRTYLKKNDVYYENIKDPPLIWFNNNYKKLKRSINKLCTFIQNSGEYVYVPNDYYHSVVNLEASHGIIYNTSCNTPNCDCGQN